MTAAIRAAILMITVCPDLTRRVLLGAIGAMAGKCRADDTGEDRIEQSRYFVQR